MQGFAMRLEVTVGGGVKFCICVCVCVSLVLTVNRRRSLLLIQSTWVICLDGTGLKKSDRKDRFWQIVKFHYLD